MLTMGCVGTRSAQAASSFSEVGWVAAPKIGWINPGVLEAPTATTLGNAGAERCLDKLGFTVDPRWTEVGVDEQLIRGEV